MGYKFCANILETFSIKEMHDSSILLFYVRLKILEMRMSKG